MNEVNTDMSTQVIMDWKFTLSELQDYAGDARDEVNQVFDECFGLIGVTDCGRFAVPQVLQLCALAKLKRAGVDARDHFGAAKKLAKGAILTLAGDPDQWAPSGAARAPADDLARTNEFSARKDPVRLAVLTGIDFDDALSSLAIHDSLSHTTIDMNGREIGNASIELRCRIDAADLAIGIASLRSNPLFVVREYAR